MGANERPAASEPTVAERVRAKHQKVTARISGVDICFACCDDWPCEPIALLAGYEQAARALAAVEPTVTEAALIDGGTASDMAHEAAAIQRALATATALGLPTGETDGEVSE